MRLKLRDGVTPEEFEMAARACRRGLEWDSWFVQLLMDTGLDDVCRRYISPRPRRIYKKRLKRMWRQAMINQVTDKLERVDNGPDSR